MIGLVTFKLPKNHRHNPKNKISDWCPLDSKTYCTDSTGEHHTCIMVGASMADILSKAKAKGFHITRIEYYHGVITCVRSD